MKLSKIIFSVMIANTFLYASISSKTTENTGKVLGESSVKTKSKKYKKKLIPFIQFKDVKLESLFDYISAKYKINIVITESTLNYYSISMRLKNVSVEDILDLVCHEHSLTYIKKNGSYYITSREKFHEENYASQNYISQRIKINYSSVTDIILLLKDVMQGTVVVRSSTENKPYRNLFDATPSLESLDTSSASQGQQEKAGGGILPLNQTEGRSTVDMNYQDGMLMVSNVVVPEKVLYIIPFFNENTIYFLSRDKELIAEAKRYIKEVDIPIKEVLIQGKIIKIGIDDGFSSFFEYNRRSSALEAQAPNPASIISLGNLQYTFLDSLTNMNIEILQKEGRAKTIASPMLLTVNRNKATLLLTEEVSIIKGWDPGKVTQVYGGGAVTTPPMPVYTPQNIGTTFEIIPFINEKNEILLNIKIEVSTLNLGSQQILVPTADGGYETKQLDGVGTTVIETTLVTTHGQGIVLGGLVSETTSKQEDKVPILGDIPYLGFPFKKIKDVTSRSETVVIITPFILDLKQPDSHKSMDNIYKSIKDDRYILDDNKTKLIPYKLIENIKDEDNDVLYKD